MRNESPNRGFPSFWNTVKDERDLKAPKDSEGIRDPFIIGPGSYYIIEKGVINSIVGIRKGTRVEVKNGVKNSYFVVEDDVEILGNDEGNEDNVIHVTSIKDELAKIFAGLKENIEIAMAS